METKIPPQALDAERALLGSILIDPSCMDKVVDIVRVGDFYVQPHQLIYNTFTELHKSKKPIDIITVTDHLDSHKKLEEIGGSATISALTTIVPSSSNVDEYAKIVRERFEQRQGWKLADQLMTDAPAEEMRSLAGEFSRGFSSTDSIRMKDALGEAVLDLLDNDQKSRIPTGMRELDARLKGGLAPGNLVIIAARPSMGKSATAIQWADEISKKVPVGFFTFEMTTTEIVTRMIQRRLGHEPQGISHDSTELQNAIRELETHKIFFDPGHSVEINSVRAKMRGMMEKGVKVFFVDYLQLMESDRYKGQKVNEMGEISKGLKAIARELKVPIVALAQLNRDVEKREPPIPRMSDLRDSGSIEQDADVIFMLYRASYYRPEMFDDDRTSFFIRKNRNGSVTTNPLGIEYMFDKSAQRFDFFTPQVLPSVNTN